MTCLYFLRSTLQIASKSGTCSNARAVQGPELIYVKKLKKKIKIVERDRCVLSCAAPRPGVGVRVRERSLAFAERRGVLDGTHPICTGNRLVRVGFAILRQTNGRVLVDGKTFLDKVNGALRSVVETPIYKRARRVRNGRQNVADTFGTIVS